MKNNQETYIQIIYPTNGGGAIFDFISSGWDYCDTFLIFSDPWQLDVVVNTKLFKLPNFLIPVLGPEVAHVY